MTWEYVDRLRSIGKGRLLLKGIMTGEDAKQALRYDVDGIVVSNHGGRAEESGRATVGVLVEIVDAVNGQVPVLIDGGVRRGTDVFKALALGAAAVGIGRPTYGGSPPPRRQSGRMRTSSFSRWRTRTAQGAMKREQGNVGSSFPGASGNVSPLPAYC
jgi:tRNA-dihydrouridine synthase